MEALSATIKTERKHTIEKELSKALVRFSYGRVNVKKAKETAARMAPVFEEEAKKNEVVAHKGVNWFAKEVLKVI
ncbi:MAG: hypothetical protein IJ608_05480 [Lachnospiraceae bacterium]|nr:hypothetical protein [Lachnospiraceae bacterium]